MTIVEYASKYNTKITTVKKWVNKGYIPGVKQTANGDYYIPEAARMPYTGCRAKSGKSILKSIVKGINKRFGVCASLYRIPELEFGKYIAHLESHGLIESYIEEEVTYYYITLKGAEWISSKINIDNILAVTSTLPKIRKMI